MFPVNNQLAGQESSAERAEELFKQHQQEIYRDTDRLFSRLMLFQWLAGIVIALAFSPQTWTGETSQIHIHVWAAIFLGGAISIFPIWMTRAWPGAAVTRYTIGAAQMLMSALLIGLTGGRIETHFHVFGSLVILSFYRDWRVLIPATLVVALDHFVRGIYWPYSVYGVLTASPWRSVEHAGWVVFENIFLVISCLRSIREMRFIANRTAQLEASEQNFRQIFEEAPIGMAVVSLDDRFTQVNAGLSRMVGYSGQELVRKTTEEITFSEDIEEGRQLAKDLVNGGEHYTGEKRYVSKNNEVLWVSRTARVIRDEDGEPRHFLLMVEDITERKRAEEALHESKLQLEAAHRANQLIMDNSQDVICTVDGKGRCLSVNAACEQLWGYTQSELIGRSYIELVHPDDRAKTRQASADLEAAGKVTDFVNRYIRKDGSLVDVLWSAYWSKADRVSFCVAHDVTERERNEKALREAKEEADRANRAKSEFLSRMSHELRTPLNAILGFGQLLERQNPTEVQRTRVSHILGAGRHLLDLINEVLDISRIESGLLRLSLEPVCISDAVAEAIDLMRPLATERSIELSALADLDTTAHILADRQRLKQVLLNLLTNAVKYTLPGGSVTISYDSSESDKVRLKISDTGPGIPPDKLSRLFTPFDRLGAEQSDVEGTGLGLALCKRLVQEMRSTIGVNSTVGKGCLFWVEFPRTASPLERLAVQKSETISRKKQTTEERQRTVLYIEDNPSNLILIEQILQGEPHIQLMTAMQGKVGLDLARQHSPDVILLDLHLPDLPGWEVLAQLQADEATRHIPTIIISADVTKQQIKRLMAAGAHAYLTKPVDMAEFLRVLEQMSRRASETRECAVA
jgi:PAS domain S-box-containing protein